MSTAAIIDAFSRLEASQQIQLVEDLWDRIATSAEPPPLSSSQVDELRRRKAEHGESAAAGRTWQEVRDSLVAADGR